MTLARRDDTIVAVATAPGRAALAIVRVSGSGAWRIGQQLIRPWPEHVRHAVLAHVVDGAGGPIDRGIVVLYRAPASFTGEDALEITCHGGVVASALITAAFVSRGARPADPGEFTRRAVLNGKLDLVQAEAIGDLVDATTRAGHRIALSQLDGGLSRRIEELRDRVLQLEALTAYDIDFPEEDDGPVPPARVIEGARTLIRDLDQLLATAPTGEIVRQGAVVVIAGAPNVGKSSLFNAMLGRRRAIVTDVPGTTRDALEAVTEACGWPIRLVDTAGLRDADDLVETMGIEMSRQYLSAADVVLACGDSEAAIDDARRAVTSAKHPPDAAILEVRTKADLLAQPERQSVPIAEVASPGSRIRVSAESGEGLAQLRDAIARRLESTKGVLRHDVPLITRERHRYALEAARDELGRFHDAWRERTLPAVVAAVHLREATRVLEELIGVVDVEDVLDRVFSSFCVGK